MSDEPLKKPAPPPISPMLDRLQTELSAGLKTGEDPLYYDWTRVAEAPPSEATYVPPMQIQTKSMDTGDLAAVIGREAAEAARHAPSPEHTVVIEEGGERVDQGVDIDTRDDAVPTEEMSGGPATDENFKLTRRRSVGASRRAGALMGLIVAGAALVLGALHFLTKPGIDVSSTSATEGATAAALGGSAVPASPGVPIARVLPVGASTVRAALPAELGIDPMTLPAAASPSLPGTAMPAAAEQTERTGPGRVPLPASTGRSRTAQPPRAVPPKQGNEVVDPLFTEKPGY